MSTPSDDEAEQARRAFAWALRALGRRAHSEAELRNGLARRDHCGAAIDAALGRLEGLGYIDDRKFARDRAERLLARGRGSLRIRRDLGQQGVATDLVEAALPTRQEEIEVARKVMHERYGGVPAEHADRARAHRFLRSRGFRDGIVNECMRSTDEDFFE